MSNTDIYGKGSEICQQFGIYRKKQENGNSHAVDSLPNYNNMFGGMAQIESILLVSSVDGGTKAKSEAQANDKLEMGGFFLYE